MFFFEDNVNAVPLDVRQPRVALFFQLVIYLHLYVVSFQGRISNRKTSAASKQPHK